MTPRERVQAALEAHGSRRSGRDWQCPGHEDQRPSLSVKEGRDGRAVLHCHAGCRTEDVIATLGLGWADLSGSGRNGKAEIVATYDYTDEHGQLLYQAVRYFPKAFKRRRPDGNGGWTWKLDDTRLVLYRLPRVLAAVEAGEVVYVVEGERDVHAVERAGATATTVLGGVSGVWRPEFSRLLAKTSTVVVADDDQPGRDRARRIAAAIAEHGGQVEPVRPFTGKDAADHLAAGKTLADLQPLDIAEVSAVSAESRSADADKAPAWRRLKLTPASKIPPKPVRWTWDGRIPAGAVTLIPGREGIGKSLLEVWLTARLTRGELPGVHHGTPKPVFYAATEDSWERTIVGRLTAAGADLDLVYRVEVEEDDLVAPLTLPVDCAALAEEIRGRGVAMLALDPLMSAIASGIDTHKDRELRLALEPLAGVADNTGCAVVGLAHFNKSASTDVLNLVTGSRAFTAVLRSVIAVARDPDDDAGTCVLSQAKNNLGRLDLPSLQYVITSAEIPTAEGPAQVGKLEFTGETDRTVAEILGERGDADSRSERDEAAEFIANYLLDHDGEAEAGQVLKEGEAAGFPKRTLQEARRRAGARTRKSEFSGGWVWALADQGAPEGAEGAGERNPCIFGAFGGAFGGVVVRGAARAVRRVPGRHQQPGPRWPTGPPVVRGVRQPRRRPAARRRPPRCAEVHPVNPIRVRQSRRKGASIGDAVSVAAPSRWANPYRHVRPRSVAVLLYRDLHLPSRPDLDPRQLRGRDLACYCPPDQPCHADVLLELANREER